MIVGDDAHIVPRPHGTTRYVEWDRVMGYSRNISPFNRAWILSDPEQDDVGIVPLQEGRGVKNVFRLYLTFVRFFYIIISVNPTVQVEFFPPL